MRFADGRRWVRKQARVVVACGAVLLLCVAMRDPLRSVHLAPILLSCVVVVAALWGRGAGIAAALLVTFGYDWFFVPPHYSLWISRPYLFSVALLLGIGLLVGQLAARLHREVEAAKIGQRRAQATAVLARELSGALVNAQVLNLATERVKETFGQIPSFVVGTPDPAMAPAGAVCIALRAPRKIRGFLVLTEPLAESKDIELLETWASLVALSIERIHFVEVAREAMVRMEGEKMRGHILSTLSHDLRTPLTGIVAGAQLLCQELPGDEGLAGTARSILEESRRMSDLVGNLLELSRLQSGGVQLRWEWNSVEELFASAIRHRKAVLQGREIVFDVPENLGLVWCDGLLVERVVVNLLDNAARHTPAGTPLRLWADEMSKFVQIGLDDEGSGFALDTVPRDGGRGGIGLSLCRAIAKTHGGRLAVDSRPAGGSRVFLELPRNPMEPEVPTELD